MEATDEFNESFFKLLINCIYGKCIENVRKIVNVNLINNDKDFLCVSNPGLFNRRYFIKILWLFIK